MHRKTQYILCPSAPGTAHHAEQRFAWPQRRRQVQLPCMPQLCTFASRQGLLPPASVALLPLSSVNVFSSFFLSSFFSLTCSRELSHTFVQLVARKELLHTLIARRELSHTCLTKMRVFSRIFVLSSGLALLSSPAAAFPCCASLMLRPSYGSPAAATVCRSPMRVATSLKMQASTKKKWRGPGNPEAMPPTLI